MVNKCGLCGKKGIFQCSKCKQSFYCSKQCQVKDWSYHKMSCKIEAAPITIACLEDYSVIDNPTENDKLSCELYMNKHFFNKELVIPLDDYTIYKTMEILIRYILKNKKYFILATFNGETDHKKIKTSTDICVKKYGLLYLNMLFEKMNIIPEKIAFHNSKLIYNICLNDDYVQNKDLSIINKMNDLYLLSRQSFNNLYSKYIDEEIKQH